MRRILLSLLVLSMLCGCKSIQPHNNDVSQDKQPSLKTININVKESVEMLKKFDNDLYFVMKNQTDEELLGPDILYKNNGSVIESAYIQGKLYDYYVNNDMIVYSDYDPYEAKGDIVIYDGSKTIIDTITQFLPQLYCYENYIYYVLHENNKTYIIQYNRDNDTKNIVSSYALSDIALAGNNHNVYWYYDNCYYVYDGEEIKKIETDCEYIRDISVDDKYLYAVERIDGTAVLVRYDLNSYEKTTKKMMMTHFALSDDYMIVNCFDNSISIYDKETLDELKIVEVNNIREMYIINNTCLLLSNDHEYIEVDIESELEKE